MKVFIPQQFPCFGLFPDIQTVVQCLHIRRKFAKIDLSSTKLQIRLDSTKYCNNWSTSVEEEEGEIRNRKVHGQMYDLSMRKAAKLVDYRKILIFWSCPCFILRPVTPELTAGANWYSESVTIHFSEF